MVPGQTAPAGFAAIATAGVTCGFTVTGIVFEEAKPGEAQVALEVITTVTISPLTNPVELNEGLFVPAFTPLTFH